MSPVALQWHSKLPAGPVRGLSWANFLPASLPQNRDIILQLLGKSWRLWCVHFPDHKRPPHFEECQRLHGPWLDISVASGQLCRHPHIKSTWTHTSMLARDACFQAKARPIIIAGALQVGSCGLWGGADGLSGFCTPATSSPPMPTLRCHVHCFFFCFP